MSENDLVVIEIRDKVVVEIYAPDHIDVWIVDYEELREEGKLPVCPVCHNEMVPSSGCMHFWLCTTCGTGGYEVPEGEEDNGDE